MYRKRKGEELLCMYAGLSGWKGRVHLSFGKPLRGEFSGANELATEIDKQIHHSFHLFPSNYIAHDELCGENSREMYTDEEKEHFMQRFRRENSEVKEFALKIYANAITNKLSDSPA